MVYASLLELLPGPLIFIIRNQIIAHKQIIINIIIILLLADFSPQI